MLPQRITLAIAFFIFALAGAALAEDWDDCKEGAATVAIKGCTSWLAHEKDADKRAAAFHQRGTVFELVGEYERSLLDFNQAIELNPNNAGWYVDRALLFFLREDLAAALADANRAAGMEPSRAAYQARAFIYYHSHDFGNAAADLAHVLELQPDDPDSVIHRYLAKTRLGEEAGSELRANAARLSARGFYFAAVELYLGKVNPDALLAQDDAPFGCRSRYYIGALSLLQNKPDEAASWFRQTAERCNEASGRWWWAAARAELKSLAR
ncbi:MAG: tetratricopeptide repeat protein [Rhodomicrobium sp.]